MQENARQGYLSLVTNSVSCSNNPKIRPNKWNPNRHDRALVTSMMLNKLEIPSRNKNAHNVSKLSGNKIDDYVAKASLKSLLGFIFVELVTYKKKVNGFDIFCSLFHRLHSYYTEYRMATVLYLPVHYWNVKKLLRVYNICYTCVLLLYIFITFSKNYGHRIINSYTVSRLICCNFCCFKLHIKTLDNNITPNNKLMTNWLWSVERPKKWKIRTI